MKQTSTRIIEILIILALATGSYSNAAASQSASGNVYYVSTSGNDTYSGSATEPFRTFTKAVSVLAAGDTLRILPGVYNQILRIRQSGTQSSPITVIGTGAVIDLGYKAGPALKLAGSYIQVTGLHVRKVRGICVGLSGSYITLQQLIVHACSSHGINTGDNAHIRILNSKIFNTVLVNQARTLTSGWGSAIKIRVSDDVLIQGNTIYRNYGEGIGSRGTNITIRGNRVFNNYSVNIYSNSENVLIEKNFVYCTPNSGFERNGKPAGGIGLGEEYFAGWGARLRNARVLNNIVAYCKNGVRYDGADPALEGGGLKYATIAYNTFYGSVEASIGIVYARAQAGNVIANNIVWQAANKLLSIENSYGISFQNNLWKVRPPVFAQSPGDQIGGPSFLVQPPKYKPSDYRPVSSSIAAGAAVNINILEDYFSCPRSSTFDIGAIQISNGN